MNLLKKAKLLALCIAGTSAAAYMADDEKPGLNMGSCLYGLRRGWQRFTRGYDFDMYRNFCD